MRTKAEMLVHIESLERAVDSAKSLAEQYRVDYELADRCFRNCQRELALSQKEVARIRADYQWAHTSLLNCQKECAEKDERLHDAVISLLSCEQKLDAVTKERDELREQLTQEVLRYEALRLEWMLKNEP